MRKQDSAARLISQAMLRQQDFEFELREKQRVEADQARVEYVIGNLSDDQLHELKQTVLNGMSSAAARMRADKDPRTSPLLRADIYELLASREVAARTRLLAP